MSQPNPYQCPQCHSDDTQRVSVMIDLETRSTGVRGVSINTNLDVGIGGGRFSNSPEILKRLAPPTAPKSESQNSDLMAVLVGGGGLVMLLVAVGQIRDSDWSAAFVLGAIGAALGGFAIYTLSNPDQKARKRDENARQLYRDSLATWRRMFFCKRCGNTFLEPEPPIQAEQAS